MDSPLRDMKIKLINGDCLEEMKKIADGSVDLVLTDPPYGTTACKWDIVIPFEPMWEQLKRVTKKNGAIVLFGSQPFTSALVMSNPKMFKYEWVWEKSKATGFLNSKIMPLISHENINVFYDKTPTYNAQKKDGEPYHKGIEKRREVGTYHQFNGGQELKNETGKRFPRTVLYFKTAEKEGKFHPTQKPLALMEYLIKTYTNEGETVLDFAAGSGTIGVACQNTKRNFILIEKEEKYCEIARRRLAQHPLI